MVRLKETTWHISTGNIGLSEQKKKLEGEGVGAARERFCLPVNWDESSNGVAVVFLKVGAH